MAGDKLSFFRFAHAAWRGAFNAMRDMPAMFVISFAATAGLSLIDAFLFPASAGSSTAQDFGQLVWTLATTIMHAFFLTPMIIAVHRYILLEEITPRYRLNPSAPRFWNFFVFSVVFQLIFLVPTAWYSVVGNGAIAIVGGFVLAVCAVIATMRLVLLFPAIAVDAPAANWRNALQDSRGHAWRIFVALFVVSLLSALILIASLILVFILKPETTFYFVTVFILVPALGIATIAANAVAASRFYQIWGVRLNEPGARA